MQSVRTKGFKADLSKVCECRIFIVGRTEKDLLSNFRRHMKDVHQVSFVAEETRRKLKQEIEEFM